MFNSFVHSITLALALASFYRKILQNVLFFACLPSRCCSFLLGSKQAGRWQQGFVEDATWENTDRPKNWSTENEFTWITFDNEQATAYIEELIAIVKHQIASERNGPAVGQWQTEAKKEETNLRCQRYHRFGECNFHSLNLLRLLLEHLTCMARRNMCQIRAIQIIRTKMNERRFQTIRSYFVSAETISFTLAFIEVKWNFNRKSRDVRKSINVISTISANPLQLVTLQDKRVDGIYWINAIHFTLFEII